MASRVPHIDHFPLRHDLSETSDVRDEYLPLSARPRDQLRRIFNRSLQWSKPDTKDPKPNFDPIEVSTTPLHQLCRVRIMDLRFRQNLKGGYLLLRVMEPVTAIENKGISTMVQDHEGNIAFITFYHLTERYSIPCGPLCPGTIFILKEPFLNRLLVDQLAILCESPTDVVILHRENQDGFMEGVVWGNLIEPRKLTIDPVWRDPIPVDAAQWHHRGQTFGEEGQLEAIRCYTISWRLLKGPNRDLDLYARVMLDLSMAYLRTGYFDQALRFSSRALKSDPTNTHALFVAGRSCYELRKFVLSFRYFKTLVSIDDKDLNAKTGLRSAKLRIMEQRTGVYDVKKLFSIRANFPKRSINCADYVGPVNMVGSNKRDCAIVAARDLEPGTLLVVSKALAFAWRKPPKPGQVFDQLPSMSEFLVQVADLIVRNPKTYGEMIYNLPEDDSQFPESDGCPKVFCDPDHKEEPIVDTNRLKRILVRSLFGDCVDNRLIKNCMLTGAMCTSGMGLFFLPSYFNRGCIPNASYIEFNDVVFIRAVKHIRLGEEVLLPDVPCPTIASIRHPTYIRRGLPCQCRICLMNNAEIVTNLNISTKVPSFCKDLLREAQTLGNPRSIKYLALEMLAGIRQFDKLYNVSVPCYNKPDVAFLYFMVAEVFANSTKNPARVNKKAIHCLEMCLKHFGFELAAMVNACMNKGNIIDPNALFHPNVIVVVLYLVEGYHILGRSEQRDNLARVLDAMQKIYTGGNITTLKHSYPEACTFLAHCNIECLKQPAFRKKILE